MQHKTETDVPGSSDCGAAETGKKELCKYVHLTLNVGLSNRPEPGTAGAEIWSNPSAARGLYVDDWLQE